MKIKPCINIQDHNYFPNFYGNGDCVQHTWYLRQCVSDGESKVWYCKEQYCVGIWNVRSMNQHKLAVVKQEMARVNIDVLKISELKWTGMGEFNSDDQYAYYFRQESLWRNGVTLIINKRVWNVALGCNLKNNRMIWVRF